MPKKQGSAWKQLLHHSLCLLSALFYQFFHYIFGKGNSTFTSFAGSYVIGLFFIGFCNYTFTGKSVLYSGFRNGNFGLLASGHHLGIGKWIGVSVAG